MACVNFPYVELDQNCEPLHGPVDGFHIPVLFLHFQTYLFELDECFTSQALVDQVIGVECGVAFETLWPALFHSLNLEPIVMPPPPCLLNLST